MYRSILVPLDGSAVSEYALPIACEIARHSGAKLELALVTVRATPAPIYVEGLPVIDEQMHSLGALHDRTYLARVHDRLLADQNLPIAAKVLDPLETNDPDQTIPMMLLAHAQAVHADLIVMTTHGRGGFARFWLGSVADILIRASHVPVLLLRPDEETPTADAPRAVQRILIPLDGSAQSETIVEHAVALGQVMQADYTLLRVVAPFVIGAAAPFTTPVDFDPDRTMRNQAEAQEYLEGVAERLRAAGALVRTEVLVGEQVAAAILEYSQRTGVNLIAMSTVGRSGLARLLIGSVADKVLRAAYVPLLLHRAEIPAEARSLDLAEQQVGV